MVWPNTCKQSAFLLLLTVVSSVQCDSAALSGPPCLCPVRGPLSQSWSLGVLRCQPATDSSSSSSTHTADTMTPHSLYLIISLPSLRNGFKVTQIIVSPDNVSAWSLILSSLSFRDIEIFSMIWIIFNHFIPSCSVLWYQSQPRTKWGTSMSRFHQI